MTNDPAKIDTLNKHLDTLESGKLSRELNDALRNLVGDIENVAAENGGKAKGEIVIKLGFKLEKDIYELTGDFTVKAPKKRRRVTHGFATPDNHLSLQNPNQVEMFGSTSVRLVGAGQDIRHA